MSARATDRHKAFAGRPGEAVQEDRILKRVIISLLVIAAVIAWCGAGWVLAGRQASFRPAMVEPRRIISLAPNITEILFALGLGDRVVGVSNFCDYPPEARTKAVIGAYWQPDIEAIISQSPDLVIGQPYPQHTAILDRLSRMGYSTASLKTETVSEFFDALAILGELTGSLDKAAALEGRINAALAQISSRVAGRSRPRVLWVVDAQPLRVAGRDTFINEMIELAGGENAIGPTIHPYPPVGIEQVIGAKADVIIQPSMGSIATLEAQQAAAADRWGRWQTIPAVGSGRIHVIDGDVVSRLGPRLPLATEIIAKLLHPDCFVKNKEVDK